VLFFVPKYTSINNKLKIICGGYMKHFAIILMLIISAVQMSITDELISTGSIYFYNPTNGSTIYETTPGYNVATIYYSWTLSSWVNNYNVRAWVDGNEIQGSAYSLSLTYGTHTAVAELKEYDILQRCVTTTVSISFSFQPSYYIYAKNSFGSGGSIIIDDITYSNVPEDGEMRVWGKNVTHSLEAIDNQTINNLLRTWNYWTIVGSGNYGPIEMNPAVVQQTEFVAQFKTQPTIPTNLSVSTQGGIQLSWSANPEPSIQYYEVWRKINSGSFNLLTTTTSTSYEDPDFAPGGNMSLTYKIRAKDNNGLFSDYSSTVYVSNAAPYKQGIGFVRSDDIPQHFMLKQNYPNPFNPATEISYSISEPVQTKLHIYNSIGQEVVELVNEYQDIGHYTIQWNAGTLPSGIYFYQLSAGNYSETKRMVLAK
jgi:hypothetical protein